MPISFRCPECDQLLRVPDEAAGKQAKCPSCETIAAVPTELDDTPERAASVPPPANPFADQPTNPYTPPHAVPDPRQETVSAGPLTHNVVDVGRVLNVTWEVFKANWGPIVGAFVVFAVISSAISFVLQFALQNAVGAADEVETAIGSLVINLISQAVQVFLTIGMVRIYLAAARGQNASVDMLFSGADKFWPAFGASFLFWIVMVAGLLLCVVPGIFLACSLWMFLHLIVDRDVGVMDSLTMAWKYSENNRMSAFVLGLIQIGLLVLGVLALCIGLLVATPFAGLMWTVAYLEITGQPTASHSW